VATSSMFGGSQSAMRFSHTRGRISGSQDYGLQYPSPFFDIAHTYLPATVKQMFRWCRYYFLVNPLINAIVAKMSEYPVTDIIFDTEKPELKQQWKDFLLEHLRYRAFQIETGLDYYTYGNTLISIFYPFIKLLVCPSCGKKTPAREAEYRFQNFQFIISCSCGHHGPADTVDHYIRAPKGIRLLRWNPEDVDIRYNDITGEYEYYYTVPTPLRNDIIMGRKSTVETVPQLFIDALRLKKAVVFSRDNIYHFKRPTLATKDRGWGTPMILPVLKDTFYLQILRKAQECVAPSTLIESVNGLVPADDVRVGDLVRTHTGQWQPVEKKWYRDAREEEIGRKIILAGLRPFGAVYSPQHPVFSLRRNEEGRRIDTKDRQRSSVILRNPHLYEEVLCPAEQLQVGDYVLYPRRLPTEDTTVDVAQYTGLTSTDGWVYSGCGEETAQAFEALERGEHVTHDNAGQVAKRILKEGRTPKRMAASRLMTEDFAYVLGWYAGDGSCGTRHVTFSLGKKDDPAPLMAAIKREFDSVATVEMGESINSVVLSDVIVRQLIKGMIPGVARIKRVPIEVLNGTDKVKLAYLRGLWEADGCRSEHQATLATSSREQAYDVYRLLLHFGCIASVNQRQTADSQLSDGRVIVGGTHYHTVACSASRDRLMSLLECGGGPEITSGKSGFFWKDYFASRVSAIEESDEEQYIDFKVKNDTTFCTPGTATKNSIALEHIVPLRILFPQAGSATSDPYCLSVSTLVEINKGYLPAGEVKVGDLVKTYRGKYLPVIAIKRRLVKKAEKVYAIGVVGMSAFPVEASEDHPFFAVQAEGRQKRYIADWQPDWVATKDLQIGDYVAYPLAREIKNSLSVDVAQYLSSYVATDEWVYRQITKEGAEVYEYVEQREQRLFAGGELQQTAAQHGWSVPTLQTTASRYRRGHRTSRIPRHLSWSKHLATIVGYYLAEGCIGNHITFSLHKKETWICDELDVAFTALLGKKGTRRTHGDNGLVYEISDSIFGEFLQNYLGHLAWNKRLPQEVVHLPDEVIRELVRCLINGDGGREECYRDNGTGRACRTSSMTFTSTSRDLALKLRELLLYLRVVGKVHRTPVRERRKHEIFRVKVSGAEAVGLWQQLGWALPELEVKKDTTRSFIQGDYAFFRVQKKAELHDVDFVYGFQVDGDKSFCVPACATHNTTVNLQDWRDHVAGEIRRWRCVSPDSMVETMEGLRPAGEVTVGDWLKNRLGGYDRVVKRHERALDPGELAYRLRVRGQHAIQTVYSEEHPIFAARKQNNGNGHKLGAREFIPVAALSVGDYVGYPTRRDVVKYVDLDISAHVDRAATDKFVYTDYLESDTPLAFEYLEAHPQAGAAEAAAASGCPITPAKTAHNAVREGRTLRRIPRYLPFDKDLMYVLGLYVAEGNATPKQVMFSLHKDETEICQRLDSFFLSRFGAHRTGGQKTENGIQIAYSSVIAAQVFHGLVPGIAMNKRLPEAVRQASDELALEAVRGVLDGDGCYYTDKTVLGTASRQLAEDVRQLLLSWEIMPGISFVSGGPTIICGRETVGHGCYLVQVSGDQHAKLQALLQGVSYTGAEHCRSGLFRDGFAWFRIEAIEEAEPEKVVAFQMDGDSTFCTWGVATHNSDNNYIPIMPLPIGNQTIGGDGRALLLSQEIRVWSEHIVAGMGVPVELIFGGMSYSGSNVSLRMLENTYLGYLQDQLSLLRWVIRNVSSYLGWAPVRARFKPFKMADDLQRKAYLFQLSQAGKLSDESLLADADFDSTKEDAIIEREASRRSEALRKQQLMQADIQGEAQMQSMKWQTKAQTKALKEQTAMQNEMAKDQLATQAAAQQGQIPPPLPPRPDLIQPPQEVKSPLTLQSVQPITPATTGESLVGQQNIDLLYLGRQLADRINNMDELQKPQALAQLREDSPQLYDVVLGLMASGPKGQVSAGRPLPEQRPPRRGPESSLI